MKTLLMVLSLCIFSQGAFGVALSKEQLLEDLEYLNAAVIGGHPVNYDPSVEVDILPVIKQAQQIDVLALSPDEYTRWIRKGIYHIGCVHTSISVNPLDADSDVTQYIPLTAFIRDDELIVSACSDCAGKRRMIESINGVGKAAIIDAFREYKASDGLTSAFSDAAFHYASSELIATVLNGPTTYVVKTGDGEFMLPASDTRYVPEWEARREDVLLANQANQFFEVAGTPVLRVTDFDNSDVRFFREVFKRLDESAAVELVLDLRKNTGGSRKAAVALTKQLVDSEFSYSILQPRLRTFRYLNGRGRFYYFLSKLKYNLGDFYRYRKTNLGGQFTYRFQPAKRNRFEGRLYVLTDGFTASAATMVTSWLKQLTDATFLGTQAGGGYNGNNGGSFPLITLPQSGIQIRFPAYRVLLDEDSDWRAGIIPDIQTDPIINVDQVIALIKAR